jgi:hypothetical protein
MAIRIRNINGYIIALCAVESDPKEGDIYLDDNIHHALSTKFSQDWDLNYGDKRLIDLMEKEKVRDAKEDLNKWIKEQENCALENVL